MVSQAPEPPAEGDKLPPINPEQYILVQSEDSDDIQEDESETPHGYTLFNENMVGEDESDEEDNSNDPCGDESTDVPQTTNNTTRRTSEVAEVENLFQTTRSDIAIDCEQVRAAMASVTLPASAIPPWAVGISDDELSGHIQRMLHSAK